MRRGASVAAAALLAVAALLASARVADGAPRRVMPWFCLERCGSNASQIAAQLDEVRQHTSQVTAASFERYNLGPNGTLVNNTGLLTPVNGALREMGLETFPMISSYPYPPDFIDWMRQLWSTPAGDAFIASLLSEAAANGYTGYNIDFEPDTGVQAADAANYAAYLNRVADALHAKGVQVTVDVATWSPLWNWTALAATRVDRLMVMSTYTSDLGRFQTALQSAVTTIGVEKLGVGLSTLNLSSNASLPYNEMAARFELLEQVGAQEIDIWQMPVPEWWWPLIAKWQF